MISPLHLLAAAGALAMSSAVATSPTTAQPAGKVKNIVLVHGSWADGSGWQGVYDILVKDGYRVSVVANPETSLADDVAATQRVLARQDGPAILVGHSYGGAVISEAGADPKVAGLVYIAAFAPDVGETVFGLLPKDGPKPPISVSADGFAFFDRNAYLAAFAPDLPPGLAAFMADSQVPTAMAAFTTPLKTAAWHGKPSWYLVSSQDQIIPPDAERAMAKRIKATTAEVAGGHVAFIAQPAVAARLIEQAANGVSTQ
jgi:pimeloyl-ACP methyl ester carboxylesterase